VKKEKVTMKKYIATIGLILMATISFSQQDSLMIKSKIEAYKESIDNADTILAYQIWGHTPEVSFIQPRGHQHGWYEIRSSIYDFFANVFSKRALTIYNEEINVYDGVAWATFYWTFEATFKAGNKRLQTKGRETQIWRKSDNAWHLDHVHYSNMPAN
jgi:ketosteroid isomerase-like protein